MPLRVTVVERKSEVDCRRSFPWFSFFKSNVHLLLFQIRYCFNSQLHCIASCSSHPLSPTCSLIQTHIMLPEDRKRLDNLIIYFTICAFIIGGISAYICWIFEVPILNPEAKWWTTEGRAWKNSEDVFERKDRQGRPWCWKHKYDDYRYYALPHGWSWWSFQQQELNAQNPSGNAAQECVFIWAYHCTNFAISGFITCIEIGLIYEMEFYAVAMMTAVCGLRLWPLDNHTNDDTKKSYDRRFFAGALTRR